MREEEFEVTRAISIQQPWAELVLLGRKTIELRGWSSGYRGKLWLHCGSEENPDLDKEYELENLFRGGYIGRITLESIVQMNPTRWENWRDQHLAKGPYRPQTFAWLITDPLRFVEPIPALGRTRIFIPSGEVLRILSNAAIR